MTDVRQQTMQRSAPLEIFLVFFKLGLISFGGPIAHLGYFRDEFVARRRWIGESGYADLVALCQFLPGPASSQVGFSLGVLRGNGLVGGAAAWLGFTLPSAVIMLGFGLGTGLVAGTGASIIIHALKLVAAAVVAQAVWGMARTLTPDLKRAAIAAAALALSLAVGGPYAQVGTIVLGAAAGVLLCQGVERDHRHATHFPVSRRSGVIAIGAAIAAFVVLPLIVFVTRSSWLAEMDAFYRSGALVFGGGHVVLPLLRSAVVEPGWISDDAFLAGYGMAQALPGPLFTFAAYLGAAIANSGSGPGYGLVVGVSALIALFLPGLLFVYGALPFAGVLRANRFADAAMQGANAAVVGILAAALYNPVLTSSVLTPTDALLAVFGFVLLVFLRVPSWIVVALLPCCVLALSDFGGVF